MTSVAVAVVVLMAVSMTVVAVLLLVLVAVAVRTVADEVAVFGEVRRSAPVAGTVFVGVVGS